MRCLAIASAAQERGEKCVFVVSSPEFEDLLIRQGFFVDVIDGDYRQLWIEDMISAVNTYRPELLFVDSYYVTYEFLIRLKDICHSMACKTIYIDDRYSFPYACDFLVNYNIFGNLDRYMNLYSGEILIPCFFLGTEYAPLRKEFRELDRRITRPVARHILVTTGGADVEHLTVELMEAIESSTIIYHFVIGSMNSDQEIIKEQANRFNNIVIHENVSEMAKLMSLCDVAISAAGSTLYELCATQTPTVTYIVAQNQIQAAEGFEESGIMKNCGDVRQLGKKTLAKCLMTEALLLSQDYEQRCAI